MSKKDIAINNLLNGNPNQTKKIIP